MDAGSGGAAVGLKRGCRDRALSGERGTCLLTLPSGEQFALADLTRGQAGEVCRFLTSIAAERDLAREFSHTGRPGRRHYVPPYPTQEAARGN